MSKIGTFVKVSALAGALALTAQAMAASTFTVPNNYSVKLVDGKSSDFGYSRLNRTLTLSPGRHQIVLLFEGSFGAARDSRLIQAANPIVIEIPDMPDNQSYTFTYDLPRGEREAEQYARAQRITLIDGKTGAPLSETQAEYYLLTSDSGFAILRDYKEDLASVGRLYDPSPVAAAAETESRISTVNGVTTVQARAPGSRATINGAEGAGGMSATVTAAAAQNKAAAASTGPKTVQSLSSGGTVYNQLVELYNSADDSTKLQFVKYIMSN